MKKILLFASAIAGLFLASCQREGLEPVGGNTVTITVEAPGAINTKAIADGTNVNEVHYAVYKTNSNEDYSIDDSGAIDGPLAQGVVEMNNKRASVNFDLLQDQNYTVIFWAQVKDAGHYNLGDLRTIEVAKEVAGNDETRAAFFARYDFSTFEHKDHVVTLRRPFAQLNLLTTQESLNPVQEGQTQGYTIDVKTSEVIVKGLSTSFNTLTGLAPAGDETFTFVMADTPEEQGQETLTVNDKAYHYVSMNYFFVPEDEKLVDIEYTVVTDKGNIGHEIVAVPVKENYRTNVIGNLLTKETTFEIIVDPNFDGETVIDGEDYITVTSIEGLQHAINNAPEGTTYIILANDIVGDVTVIQKQGVKIDINGNDKKYNGSIKVHSNSNHYADAALNIKNVNFETATASTNVIEALENGSQRYSTNITVEGCTFTATGEAENTAVGLQIKASKNAKVLNCTATGMHSLIQAQSCDETVVVKGCTINGKNGVAFKQVKAATVEGTTITALEYGIRFDGNIDNYGIIVKDNDVTATQPFIVRKMTGANNTITLEGENELSTTAEYQIVITNGSDDQKYAKPTGTYTLTGAENFNVYEGLPVAKVGNTEYDNITDAIANWTNNTTLTLVADVTLSNVITLKSTEHHVLDLGTYTMTAAKGKDAISISNEGRSSASYALDIKADANNPGGITATSKAVVKTTGKSGVKDRPIIRFYNGIYNASNVISHSGSTGTNCPQFQFHGGVYNASLSANRALIQIYGGTFNGRFYISVDSSAYALISGGKFKYLDNLYGSALNSDKFTIGSSKGNFDRGVYVDDEGYIVVGGAVITEFGDMFAAKATNASKAGSYLPYSSAAANGLYYTNAAAAIAKHGEANVVLK